MAKSNIIKELANDEVSLEVAIRRLMIISHDLKNEKLYSWCINELKGYKNENAVPEYRVIKKENILYSGISGNFQVTGQPLPLSCFPQENRDLITNHKFDESIGTIISYAKTEKGSVAIDLTRYAGYIYKQSGIQCVSIRNVFDRFDFQQILDSIKTMLLEIFLRLEESLGTLDDLDLEGKNVDHNLNTDILRIIYVDDKEEAI